MQQKSKLNLSFPSWSIQRTSVFIALITALTLLGVNAYSLLSLETRQEQKVKSVATSLSEIKTVTALGRLEPKGKVIKVSATSTPEGSRVEELLVKEGQKVKAGQIIAIIDSSDRLKGSLKEAQKKVEVAQAHLGQVKAGAKQGEIRAQQAAVRRLQAELEGNLGTQQATINRLEAELQGQQQSLKATVARVAAEKRNAQAEVQRYEILYNEGAISSQEVDRKRLSAETSNLQLIESQANQARTVATLQQQINEAKANRQKTVATLQQQINEAKATLNQVAEVRPTDVAAAQAEVDSAQATVERIKAQLDQAYIRAPKAGQVLKINTRAGETVGNEGIVDLGQTDQMSAVVEVYQSDINKVHPGQQVKVASNSLKSELLGKVDWIGLQVQKQNVINSDPSSNIDARVVEVHVQLDEASSQKAANFTNLQVQAVIEL
ncbi:MAG: biotin/lipoyl-binding protein [Spirirestis rafaelensis WJT71-NPBG6]|jgi:HlyD family secretion protein|nr:biotin/lipoyl-binding protein [Spirirestis rafaelensis WJT71-NPBG6]